jgi:hypothetical protein
MPYTRAGKDLLPQAALDWRVDMTAQWYDHDLPEEIADAEKAPLRALKLHYGCIDMRRQPDGEYRFFEVNPSGQFLFAEIDTGQPLLCALAELLSRPATTRRSIHWVRRSWRHRRSRLRGSGD